MVEEVGQFLKRQCIVNSIWELMLMTMVTELMVLAIALVLQLFVFGINVYQIEVMMNLW